MRTPWLWGVALFIAARGVHAQEPALSSSSAEDAPPGAVRVHLTSGEDALNFAVLQRGRRGALETCTSECALWLVPGRYRLRLRSAKDDEESELTLRVKRPATFRVSPGDESARAAGAVIGVAGPVAVVAGAAMLVYGVAETECDECATKNSGGTLRGIGFATFLLGALATPVGWVVFAANGPHLDVTDEHSAGRQPVPNRAVRFGLVALPRVGLGFGASAVF